MTNILRAGLGFALRVALIKVRGRVRVGIRVRVRAGVHIRVKG